jgi:hypothetical protein
MCDYFNEYISHVLLLAQFGLPEVNLLYFQGRYTQELLQVALKEALEPKED